MTLLVPLAVVTAVAAAVRSSWSPCGLSMLSSITPLAERGRGRRFGWTASWYVIGAVLGGATTGLVVAGLAAAVGALAPGTAVVAAVVLVAAAVGAAYDAGLLPPPLPHHRRQVNELWLNRYRSWVYGAGFGWQIGNGLATYIMTAAVYLTIVLAALTASPVAALGVWLVFGVVRGLAILLVAGVTSPARLAGFHRRFDAAREPVRWTVAGVQAFIASIAAGVLAGPLAAGVVAGGAAAVLAGRAVRRRDQAPAAAAARSSATAS
jgi:MFS family permease